MSKVSKEQMEPAAMNYILDDVEAALEEAGQSGLSEREVQKVVQGRSDQMSHIDFVFSELQAKGIMKEFIKNGKEKWYRYTSTQEKMDINADKVRKTRKPKSDVAGEQK